MHTSTQARRQANAHACKHAGGKQARRHASTHAGRKAGRQAHGQAGTQARSQGSTQALRQAGTQARKAGKQVGRHAHADWQASKPPLPALLAAQHSARQARPAACGAKLSFARGSRRKAGAAVTNFSCRGPNPVPVD